MSAKRTQPRVKKKRINWSKGEHSVTMIKALTYYELKKDEIGRSITKTDLIKEAANTYDVPEATLRRRVNANLVTDEGQGVGKKELKKRKRVEEQEKKKKK